MARRRPATVHGMVLIDKPTGITSHDVVGQLRRRFRERRIGHAGTLDPDATGVLVVGIGKATRLMRFATASWKTYETEIVFGVETTTLDAGGEVTATHEMRLTPDMVSAAAAAFVGDIEQVPPMVSALKVDGKRLHQLAREGVEVERQPRPVTVRRFDVEVTADPLVYRAVVECSAGTYVRSLGADLGAALGGGAHIRALRRTCSGAFDVADAGSVDDAPLRPVLDMVLGMEQVVLSATDVPVVRNGGRLPVERTPGSGPWALVDGSGELVAVHELVDGRVRAGVVLPE
jgi:tRNA pseudouridine55 synthase